MRERISEIVAEALNSGADAREILEKLRDMGVKAGDLDEVVIFRLTIHGAIHGDGPNPDWEPVYLASSVNPKQAMEEEILSLCDYLRAAVSEMKPLLDLVGAICEEEARRKGIRVETPDGHFIALAPMPCAQALRGSGKLAA